MALDHHRDDLVTAPGEVVGATIPGQSETRKNYDSTGNELPARVSRRLLIVGAAGAGALFLVGGGTYFAMREGSDAAEPNDPTAGQRGPETGSAFEKDLTLNTIKLPETLDAPTFDGVIQNVGLAIQYAVNHNDTELIRKLIPGGHLHALQPDQFAYRAAYMKGFRASAQPGIGSYNQPESPQFYPWGFKMELVELMNRLKDKPTDKDVDSFIAQVRITMGDLPQLTTPGSTTVNFETQQVFETEAAFTRVGKLKKGGAYDYLPDVDGKGSGWGLANTGKMYAVPAYMTEQPPEGYTELPDLYKKSAF